ncbi:hypothetical protein Fcan01_25878 [Folsomia candida]|uniref:Uncharacterized protein n=1 Tax=Folsomia candida TaxID=158441 RepID=A0A226D2V5_FOLCA|nr:hypothetical protein Fcan01_25878 [Folsomia candida]
MPGTQLFMVTYLLTILPTSRSWNTPGLFENCDVMFPMRKTQLGGKSPEENTLSCFTQIRNSNPYSPRVLNQLHINLTHQDVFGRGPPFSRNNRSIVFFYLQSDKLRKMVNCIAITQQLIIKYFLHVSFVFLHIHDTLWNTINYPPPGTIMVPLVLFSAKFPDQIFIPCIACDTKPLVRVSTSGSNISMSTIATMWSDLKRNLHKKPVQIIAAVPVNVNQCDTEALSKIKQTFVIYKVKRNPAQFVYFAPLPTAFEEGFISFLSPFNSLVWVSLITCCVIITLIIQCVATLEARNQGSGKHVSHFARDFLNVSVILLGHVEGDSFKMFYNRRTVATPILIVWFFGAYFIIMENLYMGSIFSCLSAIPTPVFPPNWKSLLDSKIPITTTGSYAAKSKLAYSVLRDKLIPEYINIFQHKPTLVKRFHQLSDKVFYISGSHKRDALIKFLYHIKTFRRVSTSRNESIETDKSFAIMDDSEHLKVYAKLFQWYGNRLVIQAKQDTPFAEIYFGLASRNYLLLMFLYRFERLLSFGLEDRWSKLEDTYVPIKAAYRMDNATYKKYFSRAMSNSR